MTTTAKLHEPVGKRGWAGLLADALVLGGMAGVIIGVVNWQLGRAELLPSVLTSLLGFWLLALVLGMTLQGIAVVLLRLGWIPVEPAEPLAPQLPLELDLKEQRAGGWLGLLFGCALALVVSALEKDVRGLEPWFLAFMAYQAYRVASAGTLRGNAEGVVLDCILGRFAMRWDEVHHVEAHGTSVVLCSRDGRLPLPSCSGPARLQLARYVRAQLAAHGVPRHVTLRALFRVVPKRTRCPHAG